MFDCSDATPFADTIILPHTLALSPPAITCGSASGQLELPHGNMYTSVLTVTPTLEMVGGDYMIHCAFPLPTDVFYMNYTLSVVGKQLITL